MRVLIIGLGSIARKHINAITKLVPEVEIIALRSSVDAPIVNGVKNIAPTFRVKILIINWIILKLR